MEKLDNLNNIMGKKLYSNDLEFKNINEEELFNSKLLKLELKLARYYMENRINNDISRISSFAKFILKIANINKSGMSFTKKIDRIERLMMFYDIRGSYK